ncbi:hypothetical protein E3N88_21954 [Mikania micrantha]|uniref:non-specific serine/threonine protein kinase n=1 Tax=Mikania micrantha TaxID=192012 RepID=A0A5N6NAJ5_9ASTR|nr:hypothetical protein E3N88_21954 [Mikania micrantha]
MGCFVVFSETRKARKHQLFFNRRLNTKHARFPEETGHELFSNTRFAGQKETKHELFFVFSSPTRKGTEDELFPVFFNTGFRPREGELFCMFSGTRFNIKKDTKNDDMLFMFPSTRKIRCKWLGKGKGKRQCVPIHPFKNSKRVSSESQNLDVVFPKRARNEVKGNKNDTKNHANNNVAAKNFTFKELAVATKNFKEECLLGEGGFGRVYKGKLEKTGELNRDGKQGNKEFLVEVMMLSHLCHPHLVNLVGYCSEGDQRLLVYEYMSAGSLENHLLDPLPGKPPLDWSTRIKVAMQAAKGLEYLHETNKLPIIYRDFKSSNILLDKDFNAKLSDFGQAKLGPVGDKSHVTSRVMGTVGYCAPEYHKTGRLTVKSDIYSYGVVLLELITGRRAVDLTRKTEELHLVRWDSDTIEMIFMPLNSSSTAFVEIK